MRLFENARTYDSETAIVSAGRNYSYRELLLTSGHIAGNLLHSRSDLQESRIAFLLSPSFEYTSVQWGIWRAGGVAVPLCVQHPLPAMRYVVEDARVELLVADEQYREVIEELANETGIPWTTYKALRAGNDYKLPETELNRRAMILYTSGTTNKPKGVVSTHAHIEAQITTLVDAWEWSSGDRILNVLPLHHVHGIVNVMLCALWSGACCEFLPKFETEAVWDKIASGSLTLFMGVPTMYYRLITFWDECEPENQRRYSEAASEMRLMVSGSAALPVSVLEKWKKITGHVLLERYGMTEIGMGLSNSYRGERRAGHVGLPFKRVQIKLVDQDLEEVPEGSPGQILIKGPSVFEEYWNKPVETKKAFTEDGWFITGDVALFNNGSYKILGRNSVDIIKSGGYKISALEIEDVLRKHPQVSDCAVVGIPDEEWGELVVAVVVATKATTDIDKISDWLKDQMPAYKVPRRYKIAQDLPRNVLGKVVKPEVKKLFNGI